MGGGGAHGGDGGYGGGGGGGPLVGISALVSSSGHCSADPRVLLSSPTTRRWCRNLD